MSLILLGLLLFFELTLLEALADGTAHGVEDHSDRLGRIVICRDNVINVGRITTSVYHCKYGDAQALGLFYRIRLLLYVNDEQGGRKARQVGDGTEVLLKFRALACGCSEPAYTFRFLSRAAPRRVRGSMPLTAFSTMNVGFFAR